MECRFLKEAGSYLILLSFNTSYLKFSSSPILAGRDPMLFPLLIKDFNFLNFPKFSGREFRSQFYFIVNFYRFSSWQMEGGNFLSSLFEA